MPWTPETSRDIQRAVSQQHSDFVETFPADAIDAVVIDAAIGGNIAICGDATERVEVMGRGYRFNSHLMPTKMEIVDRTLFITGNSPLSYIMGLQWGKLELLVRVPTHARVQIRMFAGVVVLSGGTSEIDIQSIIGTVEGVTQAQRARIRVILGEIQLADLHATATLRVGWGAIELLYRQLTGYEQVDARCGFGALDVRLPPDELAEPRDYAGVLRSTTLANRYGGRILAALALGGLDVKREPR